MKHEMAMTTNVRRFLAAVRELNDRSFTVEGMGLLWGQPGEGKSTTVAYATNTLDGIFLRANVCWTLTSMLGALMIELGQPRGRFRTPMHDAAVKCLMEHPRPIFIDEADYLLRQTNMLDEMRDIYDNTGSPVILIGMEEMARKVQAEGRFGRRITQWVEFRGNILERRPHPGRHDLRSGGGRRPSQPVARGIESQYRTHDHWPIAHRTVGKVQ